MSEDAYKIKIKETYRQLRIDHEAKQSIKQLIAYEEARANPVEIDWQISTPVKPKKIGKTVLKDLDLAILRKYIDWTPFFSTWMLSGKYPKNLEDPIVGCEGKRVLADANRMLDQLIAERGASAQAAFGLFPVKRRQDDAVGFDPKDTNHEIGKFHFWRQQ